MKRNLKWFFKSTTYQFFKTNIKNSITRALWKVSKVKSFLISVHAKQLLMCSQFLETKMTKYVLQLYIYWLSFMVFICFQNLFKVSVSEIGYIYPVIVVGAVIMHKMFDAGTKHLSATDDQLKVFLGPCGWRNSIFKSPSCISV